MSPEGPNHLPLDNRACEAAGKLPVSLPGLHTAIALSARARIMTSRPTSNLVCLLILAIMTAMPVCADEKPRKRERPEEVELLQDDALALLKRREARPLSDVLATAEKVVPGQVIGVKVKRLASRLVYEIKIIAQQGQVREVYVDPVTLEIVKVE